MTIVDITLHKWRMLDDRRRRVLLGLILIAVAAIIVVVWLSRRSSGDDQPVTPEPEPITTTTTSTTTTQAPQTTTSTQATTTTTPSSSTGPPGERPALVASKDGRALIAFSASYVPRIADLEQPEEASAHIFRTKTQSTNVELEELTHEGQTEKSFQLTLEQEGMRFTCVISKGPKGIWTQVASFTWNTQNSKSKCFINTRTRSTKLFYSDPDRHHRCQVPTAYDCNGQPLIVEYIEVELDRKTKQTQEESLKFETQAQECNATDANRA